MARELYDTAWIKLEVVGDEQTLQPDPWGWCWPPRSWCARARCLPLLHRRPRHRQRLLDVGCEVLMPWGAPIGSGRG